MNTKYNVYKSLPVNMIAFLLNCLSLMPCTSLEPCIELIFMHNNEYSILLIFFGALDSKIGQNYKRND